MQILRPFSAAFRRVIVGGRPGAAGPWWRLIYLFGVTAALHGAFFWWAYDDPYITFRYAENLVDRLGMVYNPGERVLSTTSPLFALLLAGLGALGFHVPRAANLIGALSLGAGGLLLWELGRTWNRPAAGWAALLLYPTFPLLVSTFGSETPLYLALCLSAFLAYARRQLLAVGILAGLAALTRGDAILIALLLGADYLIRLVPAGRRTSWAGAPGAWKQSLLALLPGAIGFAAILLPWVLFAWPYYGSPLPVTLAAKRAQGLMAISESFSQGLWQMLAGYAQFWHYRLAALLAVVGTLFAILREPRWLLLLAWPLAHAAAYAVLGVTRYFWYYAPLVPGAVLAVCLGIAAIDAGRDRLSNPRASGLFRAAVLVLPVILAGAQVADLVRLHRLPDPRAQIYRAIGNWLAENAPPGSAIGGLEVGIIGYHARPLPMVDFAGLVQPAVAALFAADTTYLDTTAWAIEQYKPDYLVLNQGQLRSAAGDDAAENCRQAALFPGQAYGYSLDLAVYDCR